MPTFATLTTDDRATLRDTPSTWTLTDEQHWWLVCLSAEGRSMVECAERLAMPYDLVKPFLQGVRRRGGWYCLVYCRPCVICGEPVVSRRAHGARHDACRWPLYWRNRRDKARQRRAHGLPVVIHARPGRRKESDPPPAERNHRPWTLKEDQALLDRPTATAKSLAKMLGRSAPSVATRRQHLRRIHQQEHQ